MVIPNYIEDLINERARLAEELNRIDDELCNWLELNDIEVDNIHVRGGCEMYVNPGSSAIEVRRAVKEK